MLPDVRQDLFGGVGFQLDGVVIDGHIVEVLQDKGVAVFDAAGQHAGEEKTQVFKFGAKMGGQGVGEVQIQMDGFDFLQAKFF